MSTLLRQPLMPYETDAVTRLIIDSHDAHAFGPVVHLTVGAFRDWLLSDAGAAATLQALAPGLRPEVVAAVSKLMRNQDLMAVAGRCGVVMMFRNMLGPVKRDLVVSFGDDEETRTAAHHGCADA